MAELLKATQDRISAVAQNISGGTVGNEYNFPAFDDLPKVDSMPQGSIWGFYDKDGKKDEAGGMTSRDAPYHDHMLTHRSRQPPHPIRCASRISRD
jgi:hypothetical protein